MYGRLDRKLDGNAFTGGIPTEMGLLIAMESLCVAHARMTSELSEGSAG